MPVETESAPISTKLLPKNFRRMVKRTQTALELRYATQVSRRDVSAEYIYQYKIATVPDFIHIFAEQALVSKLAAAKRVPSSEILRTQMAASQTEASIQTPPTILKKGILSHLPRPRFFRNR
ncbi:MAG: hypothetical protein A2776_02070 [Candidatus Levybacteria bacterium RIFCSPHIGHO2_01_FULL_40_10]|nr:MAG: hypothetical protein A2776_02070 [Candidatus Levybacteria bacterium RIFCSPHIGHO2_01_FULL_40_10]